MTRPVRIGNFSGVIGDRADALAETVHADPPVDVAVGDYMAEITMSILASAFDEHREATRTVYAPTFVEQIKPLLGDITAKGTKIVTNAGIFNPKGLAEVIRKEVADQGLDLKVAYVEGDDLFPQFRQLLDEGEFQHLDTEKPLDKNPDDFAAVNAYTGGWGIATALRGGADIVITGRVADASLITGPAAWWHDWRPDELDKVAGATAAAHIIECGPQAVGGNFSGFASITDNTVVGFPIAEVASDGTSVITKLGNVGGQITVDTVTAQLMYEIQGPLYRNPDVVLHVDTVKLSQQGPDRVQVSGAKGSPAPTTTKVGMHYFDGYRGVVYVFPTGLEIDKKIDVAKAQAADARKGFNLDELLITPLGRPAANPKDQYETTVAVRVAASGPTKQDVQGFFSRFQSYGLGSIPGYYVDFLMGLGAAPQARVQYRPGLVHQNKVHQQVVFDDGHVESVPTAPTEEWRGEPAPTQFTTEQSFGETVEAPIGQVVYARVGDKGGNANLGVWAPGDGAAYDWLRSYLTVDEAKRLLDLAPDAWVERYEMPNLHGVSFILHNYFGDNGSGNLALDQIGKATGEFLRARHTQVPVQFLRPELADADQGAVTRDAALQTV